MLNRRSVLTVLSAFPLIGLSSRTARAENFPAKPIHLIVPFPPGGGVDRTARMCAQKVSEILGQPVVVENKGGAGGVIAAQAAARSQADGYTLFFGGSASHGITPNLYKSLPYDPVKDFAPVSLIGATPYFLLVPPTLPVNNVKELIALAKKEPGSLSFGSAGNGSILHLTGELLKYKAGIDILHVAYTGGANSMTDLMAGRVQLAFYPGETAMPQVKAGKLKVLGVSSLKRSAMAPDVPTIAESGVPGFEVTGWYGVLAPAQTPKPVIATLNRAFEKMLSDAAFRKSMRDSGVEPLGGSPESFAKFINGELSKWGEVIRIANVHIQ